MSRLMRLHCAAICGLMAISSGLPAWAQGNAQFSQRDYYYNGVNKTPWYSNPTIRDHLALTDDQLQRLNDGYGSAWNRYNQGLEGLKDLSEAERLQRQQELYGDFHTGFGQSAESILADQAARDRYNQLYLQYRGYGAFDDPNVRVQLNLTPAQIQKFRQYDRDWNKNMRTWERNYATNSDMILKRYNESRGDYNERLKSDLTPAQLQKFSDLTGKPHNLSPEVYFQNAPSTNPVVRPALK